MRLFCDNKSTISIAHYPVQHDRKKHIEIDMHFIKEKPGNGLISTFGVENKLVSVCHQRIKSHIYSLKD